jgi:hypothetical protein
VGPAAVGEDGVIVTDVGAGEPRRQAEHRIRRFVQDAHDVALPGERPAAEQEQVVRARAEDDPFGLDARVLRDRIEQRGKAAVRVALDLVERVRDRLLARVRRRLRRSVSVEAEHLVLRDPGDPRRFRRRHRPAVGPERVWEPPHFNPYSRATRPADARRA